MTCLKKVGEMSEMPEFDRKLEELPVFDIDLPVFDIELEEFDIDLPELIVDMPELPTMEDITLPDFHLQDLPGLDNLPDLPSEGMTRS